MEQTRHVSSVHSMYSACTGAASVHSVGRLEYWYTQWLVAFLKRGWAQRVVVTNRSLDVPRLLLVHKILSNHTPGSIKLITGCFDPRVFVNCLQMRNEVRGGYLLHNAKKDEWWCHKKRTCELCSVQIYKKQEVGMRPRCVENNRSWMEGVMMLLVWLSVCCCILFC